MTLPVIRGVAEIVDAYDAFIVDLWGVVHGGITPYPGVVDALARLERAGKPVALLSNAPRRAHVVEARLAEIGVPEEAYRAVVTSGEATHEALADPAAGLGRRVKFIGPAWDASLLEGLDYVPEDDVARADFLLVVGLYDETAPLSDYDDLFAAARARDLVLVCANPDLVVHRQDSGEAPCAGMLAKIYAETGGRVVLHGKPDPAIFRRCRDRLALAAAARVLVVGDSLTTDIPGARAAGLDSLWVTRGIHAPELGIAPGEEPATERIEAVLARHGVRPDRAIASFRW